MGSVYPRGRVLWVAYTDADGRRRCVSSRVVLGATAAERERALLKAEAFLRRLEEAQREAISEGPLTLRRYAADWIARRRRRKVRTAGDDEARLRDWVLPVLGDRLLVEIRAPEIRTLFRDLTDSGELAPKTIHNIYGVLHCLFEDAVAEEKRDFSPCALKVRRRELPEKEDKDPTWREQAVFSMAEARRLCTDSSIPEWRRVAYAVAFLAGLREGELLGRRWRHYRPQLEPLGALDVVSSWNSKLHMETTTKTKRIRHVPVHPELARRLAEWRLSGWPRLMGRPPGDEDLLFPCPHARGQRKVVDAQRPRSGVSFLHALESDCERLGLRHRRVHDTRRSFISWCRGAGARDNMLKWVTHGRGKSILDDYTEPRWPDLCAQVLVLRFDFGECNVVPVRASHDMSP